MPFSLKLPGLNPTQQNWLMLGLVLLMGFTRFNHFGSAVALPDASWAVFFLSGFCLSQKRVFPLLMLEAVLIDYFAIRQGVSGWCVSSAYAFLVPSYAALWVSGRYAKNKIESFNSVGLSQFLLANFIGVSVAFWISNESFYRLSGKFAQLSWLDFYKSVVANYYPAYLITTFCYVAVVMTVLITWQAWQQKFSNSHG